MALGRQASPMKEHSSQVLGNVHHDQQSPTEILFDLNKLWQVMPTCSHGDRIEQDEGKSPGVG